MKGNSFAVASVPPTILLTSIDPSVATTGWFEWNLDNSSGAPEIQTNSMFESDFLRTDILGNYKMLNI